MALVRYHPDGTLDTSFDNDGILGAHELLNRHTSRDVLNVPMQAFAGQRGILVTSHVANVPRWRPAGSSGTLCTRFRPRGSYGPAHATGEAYAAKSGWAARADSVRPLGSSHSS